MATRRPGHSGPTSIRGRITMGMSVAAVLVTPVVVLSLFYISQMNATVQRMVAVDIELLRVGERISFELLQARRHEKSYLIYDDTIYLEAGRQSLRRIPSLCRQGAELEPAITPLFDHILGYTRIYGSLLDSLARLPRATAASSQQEDWARTRSHYRLLLDMAEAAGDSSRRDSLLAEAGLLASEAIAPLRGGAAGRLINERIRAAEQAVVARTDSVVTHAGRLMLNSRARVQRLSAWSQRNIITTLLVVLIVLLWLVASIPRRIVLPIKRITNAMSRAEQGDLDVRVTVDSRDELGQLARQFNRVFANLRGFDERKVERLLMLERRFKLLAADISEGVLLVDRKMDVLFANAAVEPILGRPHSEAAGHPLSEFPLLRPLDEALEHTLAGSTSRQECEILPGLPASAFCIEALRDSSGSVTAALIVVTNPAAPEPAQEETIDNPASPEPT